MNDTKLILFTVLYTSYLDRDRELATKMNVNNISVHYLVLVFAPLLD